MEIKTQDDTVDTKGSSRAPDTDPSIGPCIKCQHSIDSLGKEMNFSCISIKLVCGFVCEELSLLLIAMRRPSPLWVAPILRAMVLGCI